MVDIRDLAALHSPEQVRLLIERLKASPAITKATPPPRVIPVLTAEQAAQLRVSQPSVNMNDNQSVEPPKDEVVGPAEPED